MSDLSAHEAFYSEYLRCPYCRGHLVDGKCVTCRKIFRNTLGILDLRWSPPGITLEQEKIVSEMCNRYATATFEDLIRLRFERIDIPERRRVSSLLKRGRQMMDMFQNRLLEHYILPGKNLALDIGCGFGLSSIALSQEFKWIVGLDPSLPNLLLARKFFEEQKIENVVLIQAYAQKIPLCSKCIDYAVALNVIEHLIQVESAFYEVRRVLRNGGCFCGDSRNRFDLFLPEPHVKLRWVGLFPRKLQPWYVRKFTNVAYSGIYLLSLFELRQYGHQAFGNSMRIVFPIISAYGRSSKWDKLIELVEHIPIINTAILVIFPSHLLLASVRNTERARAGKSQGGPVEAKGAKGMTRIT